MSTTDGDGVATTWADGVATISLTRPDRLNSVDYGMLRALGNAIAAAGREEDARAIVLRGEGGSFCAGADLRAAIEGTYDVTPEETMAVADRAILAVLDSPVPVVCALTGTAVGVGASLALVADMTVMARDARLLFGFISVGLMPDGGLSWLLPAVVGRQRAAYLLMLGRTIGADEAAREGLVVEVVEPGETDAAAGVLAGRLAARPVNAMRATRRALADTMRPHLERTLRIEGRGQADLLRGPEFRAAAAAFAAPRD